MSTQIFTLEAMIENLKQEKKRIEEEQQEEETGKAYIVVGDHHGDLELGFTDEGVFHYGNFYYGGMMEGMDLRKVEASMTLLGSMIVFEEGLTEEAIESAVTREDVIEDYEEEA